MRIIFSVIILFVIISLLGCDRKTKSLEVTATAYTSNANETDSSPSLAAWGDTLKPGMKIVAVSRDLIEMGLSRGVKVSIDGLDGTYTVLDKMNKRWTRKIDIYMGTNVKRAKEWGKRKVIIRWKDKKS
jgi:3D (Asp-Asp-Asp) domain-containing protein